VITSSAREKAEKILRLALCPGAPEGEWQSAACALIRTLRSTGARAEDVLSQVLGTASTAVSSPIMRFGSIGNVPCDGLSRTIPLTPSGFCARWPT
jgi:hypothetical protein